MSRGVAGIAEVAAGTLCTLPPLFAVFRPVWIGSKPVSGRSEKSEKGAQGESEARVAAIAAARIDAAVVGCRF